MNRKKAAIIIRIAAVFIFFLVWQLLSSLRIVPEQFLAGPGEAITSLVSPSVFSQIVSNSIPTLQQIAIAFVVASSLGLGIGLAIGMTKYFTQVFEPVTLALLAIPKITLLPLFAVLYGENFSSIAYYGIFAAMFPVMVNTIAGVKQVNPAHLLLAKSMGAKPFHIYSKILLPSIIPQIFAGLRLTFIITTVEVTLAEMVFGSTLGLGSLFIFWSDTFNTGPLYATVLIFSLILIIVNLTMLSFEKRLNFVRA